MPKVRSLFFITLGSLVVLLGAHITAEHFFLYWVWSWFDIVMHALGGLALGFLANMIVAKYDSPKFTWKSWSLLWFTLLFVLLFALLWELFEWRLDRLFEVNLQTDRYDTLADIMFGLAGGALATVFSLDYFRK